VTEVYDYLASCSHGSVAPHCPKCARGSGARRPSRSSTGARARRVDAPAVLGGRARPQGRVHSLLDDLGRQGFSRVRVDGDVLELTDRAALDLARYEQHTIEVSSTASSCARDPAATDRVGRDGAAPGSGSAAVAVLDEDGTATSELVFSEQLACASAGSASTSLRRGTSRSTRLRSVLDVRGLGTRYEVDADLVVPDTSLSWVRARSRRGGGADGLLRRLLGVPLSWASSRWTALAQAEGEGPQAPALRHRRGARLVKYRNRTAGSAATRRATRASSTGSSGATARPTRTGRESRSRPTCARSPARRAAAPGSSRLARRHGARPLDRAGLCDVHR